MRWVFSKHHLFVPKSRNISRYMLDNVTKNRTLSEQWLMKKKNQDSLHTPKTNYAETKKFKLHSDLR